MNLDYLKGKNIVVYDLEIKKRVEECTNGWASFDEMGISVGCAFDYRTMQYRVFMDDNIKGLVSRLNEPKTTVVAFNQTSFDNKLLRATGLGLKPDEDLWNYDMLVESRLGSQELKKPGDSRSGFKLDDHLEVIGLPRKTAHGAAAPMMWQNGSLGTLVDYCLNDVHVERRLFEHIWEFGMLACRGQTIPYPVRKPGVVAA
jgi:hypothetical protein